MKRIIFSFFLIIPLSLFSEIRVGEIQYFKKNWDKIQYLEGDFYLIDGNLPENPTKVKIAYDNQFLYIKAKCYESQMNKVINFYTDGDIWRNDCIEVFLDTNLDRKTYYQFIVSVDGQIYGWNSEKETILNWQGTTKKNEDNWEVEIKIPFKILKIGPEKGRAIGMSICRERWAGKIELSTYTPPRGFHRPEEFAIFVFGNYNDAIVYYMKVIEKEIKSLPIKNISDKNILEKLNLWEGFIEEGKNYIKTKNKEQQKENFRNCILKYIQLNREYPLKEIVGEIKIKLLLEK